MMAQQYQQATEHFLTQARRELAAGDLPQVSGRAGVSLSRSSRLSPNSAAGNTAGIDATSLPSAGSGLQRATAISGVCSVPSVISTRTSTRTRCWFSRSWRTWMMSRDC